MSGLNVSLHGFDQLNARLASLSKDEATKAGQATARAGAAKLAKALKAGAPVSGVAEGKVQNRKLKNGKLVQSEHRKIINWIKVKKTRNANATTVQATVTTTRAYQAAFMEFGSIHTPATHWMRNAFEANKQSIIDTMGAMLNRQLVKRGV